MGMCQMLLLKICLHIYITLKEQTLILRRGLITGSKHCQQRETHQHDQVSGIYQSSDILYRKGGKA